MKILVLGASHGTGALCVKSALAKGHSVTAFSRGTKYCIDAMKEHGVKRLVVLSAHGIGESKPEASWFQYFRPAPPGQMYAGTSKFTRLAG